MSKPKAESAKRADAYYGALKNPRGTENAAANIVGEIGRILKDARNTAETPAVPAEILAKLAEVAKWVDKDVRLALRKIG